MIEDETLYYQLQEVSSQLHRNRAEEEPARKPIGYMNTGNDGATGGVAPVYDRLDLALLALIQSDY